MSIDHNFGLSIIVVIFSSGVSFQLSAFYAVDFGSDNSMAVTQARQHHLSYFIPLSTIIKVIMMTVSIIFMMII